MNLGKPTPVGVALAKLPAWQAISLALIVSILFSYYPASIVFVLAGGDVVMLLLTGPILVWGPILAVVLLIGLAVHRIRPVTIFTGLLFGGMIGFAALNGAGPAFTWVRSILFSLALPIVAGLWFHAMVESYERARNSDPSLV